MRLLILLGAALLWATGLPAAGAAPVPRVVATILPLQSIAAAVMVGVGEPVLLLDPGTSPHAASLRPSQAVLLEEADLILWVGPDLEAFMVGPLAALGGGAHKLALAGIGGIERQDLREGPLFEGEAHDHAGGDPHVWLSPANARVMARAIAAALGAIDPAHAALYNANTAAFETALDATEGEVEALLAPVRGRPFIVFHDAYHAFEHHFGMEAQGAVQLSPERQPGAARIALIRERIEASGALCVFSEPQLEPRLVATLVEGTKARIGTLDPLGVTLQPGPEAYHRLLLDLARNLAACLVD